MGKPVRLTIRAEKSLGKIADWTVEKFGTQQSRQYELEMIERCQAIAEGTAFTRDCTQLVGREVALKYAKAGMHYVVFVESDREITIIDFIHGRSGLPGHLARLAERNQDG